LVRPVTVATVVLPATATGDTVAGLTDTVYPVMGEPLSGGATQPTWTWPLTGTTTRLAGAIGAVAGRGATGVEGGDATQVPLPLTAATVKV
jgi:hypothetical protein